MSSARFSLSPKVCLVPAIRPFAHRFSSRAILRCLAIFVIALWPMLRPQALSAQSLFLGAVQNVVNSGTFNGPGQIAVDTAGNVYVADTNNGLVEIFAPGSAGGQLIATINVGFETFPQGLAVDAQGNVYISGRFSVIDVATPTGGGNYTMSQIGTGFNQPTALAVDSLGDVFVADPYGARLVELIKTPSTYLPRYISSPGVNSMDSLAVDGNGDVFLVDGHNQNILEYQWSVALSGYQQTTIFSGQDPYAVATDGSGDVFVAGYGSQPFFELVPSSPGSTTFSTLNLPSYGTFEPASIAVDGNGNVYWADYNTNALFELSTSPTNLGAYNLRVPGGDEVLFFATAGGVTLGNIQALTGGQSNLDFAADTGDTSIPTEPTCSSGMVLAAGGICPLPVSITPIFPGTRDGAIVMMGQSGNVLTTVNMTGSGIGPQINFAPATQVTVAQSVPTNNGMVADLLGNLYYANSASNNVYKATNTGGGFNSTSILNVTSGLSQPAGVAMDGAGDLFVLNSGDGAILEFAPAASGYTLATTFQFSAPSAIAIDGNGNLYVADSSSQAVYVEKFGLSGWTKSTVASGLGNPQGVAVDGGGNVYVSDMANNVVYEYTPALTGYSQSVALNAAQNGLNAPAALAVDAMNNLYAVDSGNKRVVELRFPGFWFPWRVVATPGVTEPVALTLDPSGNMYVLDGSSGTLTELDSADAPGVSFASSAVGVESSDSPKNVTVLNIGNSDLTLNANGFSPVISPGFAIDNTNCGLSVSTLTAGLSCGFSLDFIPTAIGSNTGTLWFYNDNLGLHGTQAIFQLSGTGTVIAALTGPTPGTTLLGGNVNFQWTGQPGMKFELKLGTTGPGSSNVYNGALTTNTSAQLNIPTNGVTLYATLDYQLNNTLHALNYTYTEFGTPVPPALTNPTPSTTLSGSTANFIWNPGSGPSLFVLRVGTLGVGASDVYNGSATTNTSVQLTNIPKNGVMLFVQLQYYQNAIWHSLNYTYTESGSPVLPSMTNPTPSTALSGNTANFVWNPGAGPTKYLLKVGTTGVGASDLCDGPATANTSQQVTGIPTNGVTLFVRLEYLINGTWSWIDYTYTESGTAMLPSLTNPTPSTTLSGSTVNFVWNPGVGPVDFILKVGSVSVGTTDIYNGPVTTTTSVQLANIPTDGVTLYVRLQYLMNGTWQWIDYTYTESGTEVLPSMTTPAPSSTLSGSTVNFVWNPGAGAVRFLLRVGDTGVGSSDIYTGPVTAGTSQQLTTIPISGATLFVRLQYLVNDTWHWNDYTYTEFGTSAPPSLTTPTPSTTLASSPVTFVWNPGVGPVEFILKVGTVGVGATDIYTSPVTTSTSVQVSNIPSDGGTLFVRLQYLVNGTWKWLDYTYTESGTVTLPSLTLPTPSTTLSGANANFVWNPGVGPAEFQLKLGTTGPGSLNVYNGPTTTNTSVQVTNIPTNSGAKLYARLYYLLNGTWQHIDYTYIEQ